MRKALEITENVHFFVILKQSKFAIPPRNNSHMVIFAKIFPPFECEKKYHLKNSNLRLPHRAADALPRSHQAIWQANWKNCCCVFQNILLTSTVPTKSKVPLNVGNAVTWSKIINSVQKLTEHIYTWQRKPVKISEKNFKKLWKTMSKVFS